MIHDDTKLPSILGIVLAATTLVVSVVAMTEITAAREALRALTEACGK